MTDKIVVVSTCETELEAVQIARHLIDKRVAACVTISSKARSIYRWKDSAGKDVVEDTTEFVLLIKTRRDLFPKVRAEIASIHSAEVPEIIALPIVDGADSGIYPARLRPCPRSVCVKTDVLQLPDECV